MRTFAEALVDAVVEGGTGQDQYPTTVTLTAERRIQLLELARNHSFAILGDDYGYDVYLAPGLDYNER